jgi:hypothetical protein
MKQPLWTHHEVWGVRDSELAVMEQPPMDTLEKPLYNDLSLIFGIEYTIAQVQEK